MVFSVKSALVFRLRLTPTFTTHGKEDAWGQILCFLETPQGGEKVFQALTSSPTGKIVIAELSLGVSHDLDPALRPQDVRKRDTPSPEALPPTQNTTELSSSPDLAPNTYAFACLVLTPVP